MTGSTVQVLVDGEWREPSAANRHVVLEPATGKPLCSSADCGEAEFARARQAAAVAAGRWRELGVGARSGLLAQAGARLAQCRVDIARARARESGRAFFECLDELDRARVALQVALGSSDGTAAATDPRTIGVECVALPPDNSLADELPALVRALQRGATVIWAASAQTPLAVLGAAQCFDMLPPGVLNVLTTLDPTAHGQGDVPPPEGAECVYVSPGADLLFSAQAATAWRLYASGRSPGRCTRIYVPEGEAEGFADTLHGCVALLECGDPTRLGTDLGPLRTLQELRALEDQIERALRQGMRLKLGGRRFQPWGLSGYFFQPTLLISRTGEETLDCEAFRGPVAIVTGVSDIGAAIRRHAAHCPVAQLTVLGAAAHGSPQGLAAVGPEVPIRCVRELESGGFPYEARAAELSAAPSH